MNSLPLPWARLLILWRRRSFSTFLSDPASYVRQGGSSGLADVSPEHPMWVRFAKAAAPFAAITAKRVAADVATFADPPYTVLDVAAGHGLFGIEVAKALPEALVTAVDGAQVLTVARANAEAAGVADRFRMLAGSAMDLDWGSDYDLIFCRTSFIFLIVTRVRHCYVKLNPVWRSADRLWVWSSSPTRTELLRRCRPCSLFGC